MATPMFIPPWLTNLPNPATFYERGVQIGQQQAAQQAAQQQAMLSAQREAVKEQIDQAYLQLKADEAARKYANQDKFQRLINSGMDPAQAALQVGPELASALGPTIQLIKSQQMTPYQRQEIAIRQQEAQNRRDALQARQQMTPFQQAEINLRSQPRPPKKATYTFTKSNGDKVTGTIDDPEIATLVEADKAAKSKKDAEAQEPSKIATFVKSLFGGGGSATPIPPPQAQTNAPGFKILGIRQKDQAQSVDTTDQADEDTEE